jgi:hypothetical protein
MRQDGIVLAIRLRTSLKATISFYDFWWFHQKSC